MILTYYNGKLFNMFFSRTPHSSHNKMSKASSLFRIWAQQIPLFVINYSTAILLHHAAYSFWQVFVDFCFGDVLFGWFLVGCLCGSSVVFVVVFFFFFEKNTVKCSGKFPRNDVHTKKWPYSTITIPGVTFCKRTSYLHLNKINTKYKKNWGLTAISPPHFMFAYYWPLTSSIKHIFWR